MRALFLACPLAILTMSEALAGGAAGWSGSRTIWTGPYIGAQAGYAHAELDERVRFSAADRQELELSTGANAVYNVSRDFGNVSGGFYLGYMKQLDSGLVAGLEADLNVTNLRRTGHELPVYLGGEETDLAASVYDRIKWTGGLRGRLGYAAGNLQPFVSGGVGVAKYRSETPYGANKKLYGWSLGAGLEYAVTERLIARMEYRYSDYGDVEEWKGPSTDQRKETTDVSIHDLRVGLGLKF
ncbi:outer membrane protein [Neomegalonema perideroedes]|uniref:outer membrane protein n=1 Tax=Neomegalonema perideroedes TaxID=217219 RepID=UPI00036E0A65|nr:outer membrane beta-barrel protein [Neomegalonema perideroedes]